MILELFDSDQHDYRLDLEIETVELEIESDDFTFLEKVHVLLHLHQNDDVVRVKSEVVGKALFTCVRCLDEFTTDVKGDFSLVISRLKKGEVLDEFKEYESIEDETRLLYLKGGVSSIDIAEYVRDALILSIPSKPICNESCKGLCSQCGEKLNEEPCACGETKTDSRWNNLPGLFDSKK